jgi:predicted nucleotide-binding protein
MNASGPQVHMKKSRKEVESKLQEQINKGKNILKLQINSDDDLESAENEFKLWYDYTKDVLPTLFIEDKIQEEFIQRTRVITSYLDVESNAKEFKANLNDYLTKLHSILKRLDLYEEGAIVITSSSTRIKSINKKKVWVVHGRNEKLRQSMFSFLRAIGLEPIEFPQAIISTEEPAPYIGEILDGAFNEAQATVVLFSGDDVAKLRDKFLQKEDPDYERNLTPQARPNVLFEAGMAIGRDVRKTIMVQIGTIRLLSDIAGKHITHLDDSPEKRQELAYKLQTAGCKIDITGQDWMKAGSFTDEPDINTTAIKKPENAATMLKPVRAKKKRLVLEQLRSLVARLNEAILGRNYLLGRELLHEYDDILESAIKEWKSDKNIKDLQLRGRDSSKMYYYPNSEYG